MRLDRHIRFTLIIVILLFISSNTLAVNQYVQTSPSGAKAVLEIDTEQLNNLTNLSDLKFNIKNIKEFIGIIRDNGNFKYSHERPYNWHRCQLLSQMSAINCGVTSVVNVIKWQSRELDYTVDEMRDITGHTRGVTMPEMLDLINTYGAGGEHITFEEESGLNSKYIREIIDSGDILLIGVKYDKFLQREIEGYHALVLYGYQINKDGISYYISDPNWGVKRNSLFDSEFVNEALVKNEGIRVFSYQQ